MKRTVRIVALGILLTASAASSAAARDTAVNACSLVSRDEASAAVGTRVEEGKLTTVPPGGGMDVSTCSFSAGSFSELKVSVYRFSPAAKQGLEVYRARCRQKEAATGLGDVACWYNGLHNELQVLKGTTLVVFKLDRQGSTSEPLMAVARHGLERLR
jgi:hypothetical protein